MLVGIWARLPDRATHLMWPASEWNSSWAHWMTVGSVRFAFLEVGVGLSW